MNYIISVVDTTLGKFMLLSCIVDTTNGCLVDGIRVTSHMVIQIISNTEKYIESGHQREGKPLKHFQATCLKKCHLERGVWIAISYTLADTQQIHVTEYLRRLWSNYTDKFLILNMHEMQNNSSNGVDTLTTGFLRTMFSSRVGDLYLQMVQENQFAGRPNGSKEPDYDMLVVEAYNKGLLDILPTTTKKSVWRPKVAQMTKEHLLEEMNTTLDHLPQQCLNHTQLQQFLQRSLEYEKRLYPTSQKKTLGNTSWISQKRLGRGNSVILMLRSLLERIRRFRISLQNLFPNSW